MFTIAKPRQNHALPCIMGFALFAVSISTMPSAAAYAGQSTGGCQTFLETGKRVCGRFLDYWKSSGGLSQQGLPISDEMQEQSETDGKQYVTQYFERAVFELHPENKPPYDVLLSLLGVFEYRRIWRGPFYPVQRVNSDQPRVFAETGKTLGGVFHAYWEKNGGLQQQGYPVSNEFLERSPVDNKIYTVQYFERAVFELHPENPPPYNVLLSHLGRFRYESRHGAGDPRIRARDASCLNLREQEGAILTQGANNNLVGSDRLKTYRVEEVTLATPLTCQVTVPDPQQDWKLQPRTVTLDRYWVLVITGEDLFIGNSSWYMGLDSVNLGIAVVGGDSRTELRALVIDQALLRTGATIKAGRDRSLAISTTLPETLVVSRTP
jgi:hypothetical protein